MYSEKIESLISAVIADGQISEKERDVLHKVAEKEGIDIDEIDIYVDGLIDRQNAEKEEKRRQKMSQKHGNVEKCPNCGAPIDSGAIKCPDCGYLFNNLEGNKSMERLLKMLDEVGEEEASITGPLVGAFGMQGSRKARQKAQIIKTFPIPTTKADLLDFTTTLLPLSKERNRYQTTPDQVVISKAYFEKLQECENRINIYFRDDPDFAFLMESVKKETRGIHLNAMGKLLVVSVCLFIIAAILIILGITLN